MDERTAEIVKEISDERQRLADNLGELGTKIRDASDWRSYFARSPWLAVGAAAVCGFIVSGLFSFRSR